MTQDEIIEIASQVYGECVWHESALLHLEAFAKLIAAKEREACAKICDEFCYGSTKILIERAIRARGEA
jgi:hypothetical protein